jgi:hypothetical protein
MLVLHWAGELDTVGDGAMRSLIAPYVLTI